MNPIARIGFLIKGDYSDTEMYDFMDIVYYNGASYVAKKPTIGNAPVRKNEYWQIFAEGGTLTGNSDISDTNVTFEQASDRVNISSKEKLSVIMGKIKKWFTDLKSVAFSGSYEDLSNKPDLKTVATTGNYSDLSNKPTIPTALKNPKALTFTGGVTGSYDGSAAKSVKVPSLTNNLLATAAGTALDAAQGKVLDGKIAQINRNLSAMNAFTLLTATWNTGIITNHQYCGLYKIGKIGLFSLAFECKALKPWTNYKLCDITSAGFSFAHDTVGLVNDQNDDSAVTIECTLEHPKSIYLRTFEKTHSVTWYRGFVLVLCTN
ncbi:hypothetical protein D3Z60_21625 [Lachnospiraceae bacterium]|nr:hypothetical protein [Lachnospiraceae bacterium]